MTYVPTSSKIQNKKSNDFPGKNALEWSLSKLMSEDSPRQAKDKGPFQVGLNPKGLNTRALEFETLIIGETQNFIKENFQQLIFNYSAIA